MRSENNAFSRDRSDSDLSSTIGLSLLVRLRHRSKFNKIFVTIANFSKEFLLTTYSQKDSLDFSWNTRLLS